MLPLPDETAGRRTLRRLQVSAGSVLGALALSTGGLLVDHGWLRVLGAGVPGLPGLDAANGLGDPEPGRTPPGFLVVGYDVLGGAFAVDGGALGADPGEVCHLAPDTLEWTPLGGGHSAWLQWALEGGLEDAFADLRWPGWRNLVGTAAPGQGVSAYPPPWSREGRSDDVHRGLVPLAEAVRLVVDWARQIGDLPPDLAVEVPTDG